MTNVDKTRAKALEAALVAADWDGSDSMKEKIAAAVDAVIAVVTPDDSYAIALTDGSVIRGGNSGHWHSPLDTAPVYGEVPMADGSKPYEIVKREFSDLDDFNDYDLYSS